MVFKINCIKITKIIAICLFILPTQAFTTPYQNQNQDTLINLLTNDTTVNNNSIKEVIVPKNNTSKKNWITTPPLPRDSANTIATKLLAESEVFTESWSSASVFVYAAYNYSNLPDPIEIPLINDGERFQLTWYGNLNYKYGMRWGRMHKGLDLHLQTGDSVVSAFDGIVRYAEFNTGGFGNCVVVRHTNGLETVYGHLSKIMVSVNQYVQGGETVGLGGTTGNSTGPHLHFETRYKDFTIDPEMYFDFASGKLISDKLIMSRDKLSSERYPSRNVKLKRSRRSRSSARSYAGKKYGKQSSKKTNKISVNKKKKGTTKKSSLNNKKTTPVKKSTKKKSK